MSLPDPERYKLEPSACDQSDLQQGVCLAEMTPDKEGEWVRWSEYRVLKALLESYRESREKK